MRIRRLRTTMRLLTGVCKRMLGWHAGKWPPGRRGAQMSALHFIALGLVIALVIYLLLVLFNPEDYS